MAPDAYYDAMPLTLPLPDWMPWWAQLLILVVAILFGIAFLMMPFAVFGLKGRLDFLEAQLDDIHAELRMVTMRLPDPERPAVRTVPPEPVVERVQPPPPPRRPRSFDDWPAEHTLDDDEIERSPRGLRAPRPRDPDRSRAEPTLRRPPQR